MRQANIRIKLTLAVASLTFLIAHTMDAQAANAGYGEERGFRPQAEASLGRAPPTFWSSTLIGSACATTKRLRLREGTRTTKYLDLPLGSGPGLENCDLPGR